MREDCEGVEGWRRSKWYRGEGGGAKKVDGDEAEMENVWWVSQPEG